MNPRLLVTLTIQEGDTGYQIIKLLRATPLEILSICDLKQQDFVFAQRYGRHARVRVIQAGHAVYPRIHVVPIETRETE
jgi:hypothetical protein